MLIGCPPGPSLSMIAGMRLFGLILRNSGLNCSPFEMLIGTTLYGSPISSSATDILRPFGVFQVHNSMLIGGGLLFARGRRAGALPRCPHAARGNRLPRGRAGRTNATAWQAETEEPRERERQARDVSESAR